MEFRFRRLLEGRGRAFSNLVCLAAIQGSNAVLPVVIYPFVLSVLGADKYSHIVLAEAISFFLLSFVLYSFEIDGVMAIVGLNHQRDGKELSARFSEILFIRCAFYIVGLVIVESIVFFFFPGLGALVFAWSLVSLAYAVQPNWFYLGVERNGILALFVVTSRLGALATVIFSVSADASAERVPYIIGIWYLISGCAACLFAVFRFNLSLTIPSWKRIRLLVWGGKEVFLGNFATGFYRDSNVLILGLFGVSAAGIASYSLAEKFVKAIQASIRPLNQLFFPRAIAVAKEEKCPSSSAFWRISKLVVPQEIAVFGVMCGLLIVYFALSSARVVDFTPEFQHAVHLAMFMGLSTFAGVAVFMLGSAGLNTLGARRYLLGSLVIAAVISVAANLVLVPWMGEVGAAICFVVSECALLLLIARRYFA